MKKLSEGPFLAWRPLQVSPAGLESAVASYISAPSHSSKFELKTVPICAPTVRPKAKILMEPEVDQPEKKKQAAANQTQLGKVAQRFFKFKIIFLEFGFLLGL